MRHHGDRVVEHEGDLAGNGVRQTLRAFLVGHVQHGHIRLFLQQFARQVAGRPVAGRCEGDLAIVIARVVQQVLKRRVWRIFADDQQSRRIAGHAKIGEVFGRIVGQLAEKRLVDGKSAYRTKAERIAVRLGLGDKIGSYRPARARLVFDHDGLTQLPAKRIADDARRRVGGRTRAERHDQPYGFFRIGGMHLEAYCGQAGQTR